MALTSPSLDASPICVRGSESADQVRRLTRRWALRGVGKGARLVKTFRLWGEKGPVPPLFCESFRLWGGRRGSDKRALFMECNCCHAIWAYVSCPSQFRRYRPSHLELRPMCREAARLSRHAAAPAFPSTDLIAENGTHIGAIFPRIVLIASGAPSGANTPPARGGFRLASRYRSRWLRRRIHSPCWDGPWDSMLAQWD